MKIQAVIFDLDGTLLDTIEDLQVSMNEVLRREGYPALDREAVRRGIGNGAREFMKCSLPAGTEVSEQELDRLLDVYSGIYGAGGFPNPRPFEGIPEVLDRLGQTGVKRAVLSNKTHSNTQAVIEKYFGRDRFDVVMGKRAEFAPKPDPASLNAVIAQLGVPRESVLFTGDGDADYLLTVNAGVAYAGALWGYRTEAELRSLGADRFCRTPRELLELVLAANAEG